MSLGPQVERNVTLKAAATRMNSQRGSDHTSTFSRVGHSPGPGGAASFFASQRNNASAMNTMGRHGQASKQFTVGQLSVGQNPSQHQLTNQMPPQTTYMLKKQNEETRLLKNVIQHLCAKLKDYQKQFISNKSMLAQEQASVDAIVNKPDLPDNIALANDPAAADEQNNGVDAVVDDGFAQLLGGHTIGPLVQEYESHIKSLMKDIRVLKATIGQQAEIHRELMGENEKLVANLEVKQREYLKLIEETRTNVAAMEMLGADDPASGVDNAGDASNGNSRERIHLLTEENHILFEQVTLLRAHHDQFSKECAEKMSEAQTKIDSFNTTKAELDIASLERNELLKANSFLESKLTSTTQILSQVEEGRRTDHLENKKMREQLSLFQKEYSFYKNLAEKLETKQGQNLENLNINLREVSEREKDQRIRLDQLEGENAQMISTNRALLADMTRQQRELKQIMAINEEYQLQANSFRERELQFTELSREYKEKLEIIKFEREKLALKEEQFVRQVQKAESVQKQESAKQVQIYESKMQSRQRDMRKAVEDLEDKLSSAQDEADECRRKAERLDKLNVTQRQSLEENHRKEERLILQFDKLIEQLRAEIKEKERELHAQDTRAAYAKQEVVKQLQEVQLKMDFQGEQMHQRESQIMILKNDLDRAKEEGIMLKAAVKEGDKTRETLTRQMTKAVHQELQHHSNLQSHEYSPTSVQ